MVDFWKRKYLYPFGDISPIDDHDQRLLMEQINHPEQFDLKDNSHFELLVSGKYRLTINDLGGEKYSWLYNYWIDQELKKPLQITHEQISNYLNDFINKFPLEAIPHKTEDERNMKIYRKLITNMRIKIGYLKKNPTSEN